MTTNPIIVPFNNTGTPRLKLVTKPAVRLNTLLSISFLPHNGGIRNFSYLEHTERERNGFMVWS